MQFDGKISCHEPLVSMTCDGYRLEVAKLAAMYDTGAVEFNKRLMEAQNFNMTWNQTRVELFKAGIIQKELKIEGSTL